jgi:excisionase family DNA binding protein
MGRYPSAMTLTDDYYTPQEVAALLKFKTPRLIWTIINNGELPAIEVARQWRISRDDLWGYLNRQRVDAPELDDDDDDDDQPHRRANSASDD